MSSAFKGKWHFSFESGLWFPVVSIFLPMSWFRFAPRLKERDVCGTHLLYLFLCQWPSRLAPFPHDWESSSHKPDMQMYGCLLERALETPAWGSGAGVALVPWEFSTLTVTVAARTDIPPSSEYVLLFSHTKSYLSRVSFQGSVLKNTYYSFF